MYSFLQFIKYWLTAVKDHSLQAPFIYDFYSRVLKSGAVIEDQLPIESIRKELKHSDKEISVTSFGAKSKVSNKNKRKVKDIAKRGITPAPTSLLLNRLISVYNLHNIVELGTAFGINTMYLALDKDRSVTTFEGCPNTMAIAEENFERLEYNNIRTVQGNIDQTLPEYLSKINDAVDFAYIDANHQLQPTLNYFELLLSKSNKDSVMVFDDIHWSAEMSQAWQTIIKDPRVTLSVDLFDLGIVFFKQELNKQHYTIRY